MANEPIAPAPRHITQATLRNWRREIRLCLGALDGLIDRLERLEREIDSRSGACLGENSGESETDPIVYNIHFQKRADGTAAIALDGGKQFTLAPQLAEFFQFLSTAERDANSKDPLVGWRTRKQILDLLAGMAARVYPERYVNNLVHRLKEALKKAGYSRALIQTHRRKGVRLAYKRSAHGISDDLLTG